MLLSSIKEPLNVVFGGSFDPFHMGHYQIIQKLLTLEYPIQKIWVVPAFLNPFKKKNYFTPKERLHWIRLSLSDTPTDRLCICCFELRRRESTPTFVTITYLKERFLGESFALVIGEDQLFSLKDWFYFEHLKEQVIFFVFGRRGFNEYSLDILKDIQYVWVDFDVDISASMIREGLLKGDRNISRYLSPKIIHKIF